MNGIPEAPTCEDAQSASPITLIEKRCRKCGEIKPLAKFYFNNRVTNGRRSWCIICEKEVKKQWRGNNLERLREAKKQWSKNNLDKRLATQKRYAQRNPDKIKQRQAKYKEQNQGKKWRKLNLERARELGRKGMAKILATPKGNLNARMRRSLLHSLKNGTKNGRHWEDLVGYAFDQLKKHLEKHFLPGMSWENRSKWHIDHVIPISAFNFQKPEDIDFKRCWALKNLRPLWAKDNIKKSNKLKNPFQPALLLRENYNEKK